MLGCVGALGVDGVRPLGGGLCLGGPASAGDGVGGAVGGPGLAVGGGVGAGVGERVGGGVGAAAGEVMTTDDGLTALSVAVFTPPPDPLVAENE